MTAAFTWHPEPALLAEVLQLAQQQGRSPEAVVTDAVLLYLHHSLTQANPDDPEQLLSLKERLEFMKLPLQERQKILQQQADEIDTQHEQDYEWREWQAGDFIE